MGVNPQFFSTYDPHGYEPLIVDENCLSSEDCRQALLETFETPRDWRSFLTPKELDKLDKGLKGSEERKSPHVYYPGESPETCEKRSAAAQLGLLRGYAREKYSHGRRFWYGDVPPWLQSDGGR